MKDGQFVTLNCHTTGSWGDVVANSMTMHQLQHSQKVEYNDPHNLPFRDFFSVHRLVDGFICKEQHRIIKKNNFQIIYSQQDHL